MDAVTVKVYVEKWFGKPPLRILICTQNPGHIFMN